MREQQTVGQPTEAWKELITRLPGVLNVEFVLEGEIIREIHVLAGQSRSPKQIVRDIQSAMAARFQIELDHRIVSVAQIPSSAEPVKKRLLYHKLDLSTSREGTTVTVTLEWDGVQRSGEGVSISSTHDRNRCIAQATVEAINAFLRKTCRFSLVECKKVSMSAGNVVFVGLELTRDGKLESLVGACPEGDEPHLSVLRATLDAVNRRILTLAFLPADT